MDVEIILPLVGAVISMLAGGITASEFTRKLLRKVLKVEEEREPTYSERLSTLIQSLNTSTKQVDAVLSELATVAKERQSTVLSLEANLASLEVREKDLQQRVEHLKNVPLPAVEHFAQLLEVGEKRSAWRDYMLFGAGVVVSTVISIALKVLGLG